MDFTTFYRSFRFQKGDLGDLMTALLIPEEVVSAQQVRVTGREALCMTLRPLAYPNSLCELELFFRRLSSVISSVVSKVLAHTEYYFVHLLSDLTVHKWLNLQSLALFSQGQEMNSDHYVVLFKESLNENSHQKRMDVHVRYWAASQSVTTRYYGPCPG
ncbi:hypothetical protein MTO96_006648 [Rhipicephalus appendiculatus]